MNTNLDRLQRNYIYKGKEYLVEREVKSKNPVTREWDDAVLYKAKGVKELSFVREESEFLKRFKPIKIKVKKLAGKRLAKWQRVAGKKIRNTLIAYNIFKIIFLSFALVPLLIMGIAASIFGAVAVFIHNLSKLIFSFVDYLTKLFKDYLDYPLQKITGARRVFDKYNKLIDKMAFQECAAKEKGVHLGKSDDLSDMSRRLSFIDKKMKKMGDEDLLKNRYIIGPNGSTVETSNHERSREKAQGLSNRTSVAQHARDLRKRLSDGSTFGYFKNTQIVKEGEHFYFERVEGDTLKKSE